MPDRSSTFSGKQWLGELNTHGKGGETESAYYNYCSINKDGWTTRAVERTAVATDRVKKASYFCKGVSELRL